MDELEILDMLQYERNELRDIALHLLNTINILTSAGRFPHEVNFKNLSSDALVEFEDAKFDYKVASKQLQELLGE
jgi:hypothetical protein